jgi:polyphosphate kinase 2
MSPHPHHPPGHPPGSPGAAPGFEPSSSTAGARRDEVSHDAYDADMRPLRIELAKLQRHVVEGRDKILVLVEGRDASGKNDCIRHLVEHLGPRETRVVALGKPSDRETGAWHLQRYVAHLPVGAEMVFFNRSWYNRAGVEHVMGFCSKEERDEFFATVPHFEQALVGAGIKLVKVYLDVGRPEQAKRLAHRADDPLQRSRDSPVNASAGQYWVQYSEARNAMLLKTHTASCPWIVVRADNPRLARLNLARTILSRLFYPGKNLDVVVPDPDIAFEFSPDCIPEERLAL